MARRTYICIAESRSGENKIEESKIQRRYSSDGRSIFKICGFEKLVVTGNNKLRRSQIIGQ